MTLEEDLAFLGLTGPTAALRLKISGSAHFLTWFTKSPNSTLCAASIVKITQRLLPPDADGKFCLRFLRTDCGACLDGLVHFVAVPGTDDQLRQLQTRLNECHCDLTNEIVQTIHDADSESGGLSFADMISSIFTILSSVIHAGIKVGHVVGGSPAPETNETAKKWPANAAALFPAGQEAAVTSFARLFRLTKSAHILDFIRILLPHCPSLALPISASPLFWEVMVEGLQAAVDEFHEDPSLTSAAALGPDSTEEEATPRQNIRAFTMLLADFIPILTETLKQKITASALMPHGRKIHDLLLKVLQIAKGSPNQDGLATFCLCVAGMALCVASHLPKSRRPPRIHPLIKSYGRLQREPTAWASMQVFVILSRLAYEARCCNVGCTETSESSAQKLRYCARCRLMRYCSSGCQKAAWKEHKGICPDLEKLNTKAISSVRNVESEPTGQFMIEFEKKTKKLGFTEGRMKEIAEELTPFCDFRNQTGTS
ncbi:hypothetical protein DFH07DRAFT_796856 [Mycena maculata]|uniref:MYND-type domain-containing protein n=1 Tax=Mycena maculata TaxID=230809 RepID=A0AAD7K4H2_9AGAR|nr:hypothetical protein DFH07DRAFT_796856 [Mycena maculata]